jgi:hypothetical protein
MQASKLQINKTPSTWRLNLLVSAFNTFATLFVLAVVLLQLLAVYRN